MIILEKEKRGDKTKRLGKLTTRKKIKIGWRNFYINRGIGQGYMDTVKINGNVHHQ